MRVLNAINPDLVHKISRMLHHIELPLVGKVTGRISFVAHRSATLGMVIPRITSRDGHEPRPSKFSEEHPILHYELLKLGEKLCPEFKFSSVHVNHNVVCPPHKDKNNVGKSMLISFGDYTGCNIVVDDIEHNAFLKPIIFNGSQLEHWNTRDLKGNKYSLVFYSV